MTTCCMQYILKHCRIEAHLLLIIGNLAPSKEAKRTAGNPIAYASWRV
mgnify:CR=1 FL=1